MRVWLIIGAAFMLPLCAADNSKYVLWTDEEKKNFVLEELIIKHYVENPADMKDYFNINKHINTFLDTEWKTKIDAWREKRKEHLKKWADAHVKDGIVRINKSGLGAILVTKKIHPCDTFENTQHKIIPMLEEMKKNNNSNVYCFVGVTVDENNHICCKKFLYRLKSNKQEAYCADEFACIDLLNGDGHDDKCTTVLCFDFIKERFSEKCFYVKCGNQETSTLWLRDSTSKVYDKLCKADLKMEEGDLFIDLSDILSWQTFNALQSFFLAKIEASNRVYCIEQLKKLTDTVCAYGILNKLKEIVSAYSFSYSPRIIGGKVVVSTILNSIWFYKPHGSAFFYSKQETSVKLSNFARARFELFKEWSGNHCSTEKYCRDLGAFFKKYTHVIVQKNILMRYDALNHEVLVLKFEKDRNKKIVSTDLGTQKVPNNIKPNTLHLKKNGTLTYKLLKHSKNNGYESDVIVESSDDE